MRKLVSVLVIAVMVMALAVPAFASQTSGTVTSPTSTPAPTASPDPSASPAPTADPDATPAPTIGPVVTDIPEVGDAVDENGEKIDVEISAPTLDAGETLKDIAENALQAAEDAGLTEKVKEATAAEVFDINMKDGSQPDGSVQVTIVRDGSSGEIAAIMYQNEEDGTWDEAKFVVNGDGTVTITFEHFCTVVLLVKEPTQAPDVKPTAKPDVNPTAKPGESGGSGSSGSGSSGSGSTGSGEPTSPQTGYDCA